MIRQVQKALNWTNLTMSYVDMIHVSHRDYITILMVVQAETNFVKEKLNIEMG